MADCATLESYPLIGIMLVFNTSKVKMKKKEIKRENTELN